MKRRNCIRTPLLRQMENTDCGAVALGIVLSFYGRYVPSAELRKQSKVSRDGVSVVNLIAAAQANHLDTFIQKECPSPDNFTHPMILFFNLKHFVVLEGFKGKKAYINDPSTGRRTIHLMSFQKEFSGIAIQLTPSIRFQRRPKENKWRDYLVPWIQKERKNLSILIASTIGLTLINLAIPIFSKFFIDHYTEESILNQHSGLFIMIALALIVQISIVYIQRKITRIVERKSSEEMGAAVLKKLIDLPPFFFAQRRIGDLAQRLQAIERLTEMLSGSLSIIVVGIVQSGISLILMLHYSPILTFLACLILVINFSFFHFSKTYRYQLTSTFKTELLNLHSLTMGAFSMILQIKAKGDRQFLTQWKAQLKHYLCAQKKLSLSTTMIQASIYLFVGFIQVLILGLGSNLVIKKELSIGALIAFNGLFLSLMEFVFQMANLGNPYQQAKLDREKILDVMEYPQEQSVSTPSWTKLKPFVSIKRGKIEIIDLTFGYNRGEKPLFNELNLVIEPHSKIAITGSSGSGKSTLANLITGLYQPWAGVILIDGVPVSELSKEKRTSSLSLMGQEQFFIKGSIKDNLCLWDNRSEAEIVQAMKFACIEDLVLNSNEGLNFQLTEGASNLSGGQRQRLEIARTLLRNSNILILDEATSALDPLIEEQIIKNIFKNSRTNIWIAHRLTTIRQADKILILNEGKIVDSGSHQTLIQQKSDIYFDLFKKDIQKEMAV